MAIALEAYIRNRELWGSISELFNANRDFSWENQVNKEAQGSRRHILGHFHRLQSRKTNSAMTSLNGVALVTGAGTLSSLQSNSPLFYIIDVVDPSIY
jgi:hypothetical protein